MGPLRLADATAVILAGGLGTRLAPVVPDRPKVLADVAGRPFLAHVLDRLLAAGVRRAIVSTGHLGRQVEEAFGYRHAGMRLVYSHEPEPAGTGGALRLAQRLLARQPVLVLNGDSLSGGDLVALWEWHRDRGAPATMLLVRAADPARFGRVETAADGTVLRLDEKSAPSGPAWINAGVYVIDERVLDGIPADRVVSFEREVLPGWIGRGLHGFCCDGTLLDIGTPEDYAGAAAWLAQEWDQG